MNISCYADLLNAAREQAEPQRLLFVFAGSELPRNHTDDQKQRYIARQGGTLSPVMCVDKLPSDLGSFASLVEESRGTGMNWDIVFVASMSGRGGIPPNSDEAEQPLKMMVEAINNSRIGNFLTFNRDGELVQLS